MNELTERLKDKQTLITIAYKNGEEELFQSMLIDLNGLDVNAITQFIPPMVQMLKARVKE